MQVFKFWFALLALVALAFAVEPPSGLLTETTYSPEKCKERAQAGDRVKVHYVS